jgi:hypothetical protein
VSAVERKRKRDRERANRNRQRWREAGLCPGCGCDRERYVYCVECRAKLAKHKRAWIRKKRRKTRQQISRLGGLARKRSSVPYPFEDWAFARIAAQASVEARKAL